MAIDHTASNAYVGNRFGVRRTPVPAGTPVGKRMSAAQRDTVVRIVTKIDAHMRTLVEATPVQGAVTQEMKDGMLAEMTPAATVAKIQDHLNRTDVTHIYKASDSLITVLQAQERALATRVAAITAPADPATPVVPEGYYALDYKDVLRFYRVVYGTGRHAGRTFVNRFRSDQEDFVGRVETAQALAALATPEGQESARQRFAQELTRCYACGRMLTDPISKSLGIGPDCRSK